MSRTPRVERCQAMIGTRTQEEGQDHGCQGGQDLAAPAPGRPGTRHEEGRQQHEGRGPQVLRQAQHEPAERAAPPAARAGHHDPGAGDEGQVISAVWDPYQGHECPGRPQRIQEQGDGAGLCAVEAPRQLQDDEAGGDGEGDVESLSGRGRLAEHGVGACQQERVAGRAADGLIPRAAAAGGQRRGLAVVDAGLPGKDAVLDDGDDDPDGDEGDQGGATWRWWPGEAWTRRDGR